MQPEISVRYAQHKRGLKLHIVPVLSGADNMAQTALCGKRVVFWRMTINMALGKPCHNCRRVNQQRGYRRAVEIIQRYWAQAG